MKGSCQFNAPTAVAQPSSTRHPLNRDWLGYKARVIKAAMRKFTVPVGDGTQAFSPLC